MRKVIVGLAALALLAALQVTALADIDQFRGHWINVNAHPRGIDKMGIRQIGLPLKVHPYGACSPTDCDWGAVEPVVYATSVSDNLNKKAIVLSASFNF